MELPKCPRCGSNSQLESHYSVLVGPRDLPLSVFFTVVVITIGNVLAASSDIIAVALLLAIAPLFLSFFQKYFCDRCEIEFRASPPASRPTPQQSAK